MTDLEFEALYRDTLLRIENAIEESDADIDYESVNDILTLTCPDGSCIIITRQSAAHQLWVAARSGGYHFEYDEGRETWICTSTRDTLEELLNEAAREQGGVDLEL